MTSGLPPDLWAPLHAARVSAALTTRWLGRSCETFDTCVSTNDLAAERGRAGAAEGLVIVSDQQSRGRGRMGRDWFSPRGENLYFSLLLRPVRPPAEIPPLTLLAGAALAEALAGFGVVPRLKWPNDVLVPDTTSEPRKVAGILTEMVSEGNRVAHVVVGIGLNVNGMNFPAELAGRATSLALARGQPVDRVTVLCAVLSAFERAYEDFRANGPRAAVSRWSAHAALGGRCRVAVDGREVSGVALGLDPDGALRVRDDDGQVIRVISGEITA
jgi:BirA family transcriptional regulator, biotin operon repressor / biotin---[acetyl-CoA-carboxylase] ligase